MTIEQALQKQKEGKFDEARRIYQSLLQQNPDHQIFYHLGLLELQTGKTKKAIGALQKALKSKPDHVSYYILLGKVMVKIQRPQLAEQYFHRAAQLEPNAEHFFLLGKLKLQLQKEAEAIECWKNALKYNPNHLKSLLFLGNLYDKHLKPENSLGLFKRAYQIAPQNPHTIDSLSLWYSIKAETLHEKDPKKALELINQALQYKQTASLFHQKADLLQSLGASKQAEEFCLRAIQEDAKPIYYHTLGNIYRTSLRKEQALEAYETARDLGLNHPATLQAIQTLKGEATTLNSEVVQMMFNQYAEKFDRHLISLGYDIPQKMALFLKDKVSERSFVSVLDIGCGTGMSLEPFLDCTRNRVGIDISENMLKKAREKGLYQDLHQADAIAWLEETQQYFDLILCFDMTVYIGDLEPMFSAIFDALEPNGLFLLSTEKLEQDDDFALLKTERFSHANHYIEKLCQDRFEIVAQKEEGIRKEMERWILGMMWILKRVDR